MLRRNSPSTVEDPIPGHASGGRREITEGEEIFGKLVAVRRAGLGLSQDDLAARTNTKPSDIAGIEAGRAPSEETLKRLAAALNVEPGTGALWSSLGGRWLWASVAV